MEQEQGLGGKSKVKTDRFLLLAGKAQAEDLEGWLLPPPSNCLDDWECGPDRAHSSGLESGHGASSR